MTLLEFTQALYPSFKATPFHQRYYALLEAFAEGRVRRLIITIPPQHGKSLGSSVILPAWLLGKRPDLHIAIHTNASSNPSARGIQAMYPPARYGEHSEHSKALCKHIAAALKTIYDGSVWTREYAAAEINDCPSAGCYLELGYGNTNAQDARFVHDHPVEIAKALADGMEAWFSSLNA